MCVIGRPEASTSGPSATSIRPNSTSSCRKYPLRSAAIHPDWLASPLPGKSPADIRAFDKARPATHLAWQTFKASVMDQRVDNERRADAAPSQEARPASGRAVKKRSLFETIRQRRGLAIAIILVSAIVILAVALWWLHARNYESTDDAFIDTRTVQISPQVAAAVVDVPVTDNQSVEAGAELVRLDDRDYIAQRDQAQANINNFAAQIVEQKAKIDQAERQVAQAQATLTFAQQQADRYQTLAKQGSGSLEQAQQYQSGLQQSQAALAAAQANAAAVTKEEPVLEAQLKNAQAQLAQADANLSRTIITAPVAGRVTHL